MPYLFTPPQPSAIPVAGGEQLFPLHRIYCVGKNYADHIREMGSDPAREPPCFFLKPTDSVVTGGRMPYPPGTRNLHYEGELVLAIGRGGVDIAPDQALTHVYGFALGLDMTRRDLQTTAGGLGQPWDTGKSFDHCAPVTAITPGQTVPTERLQLWVNGILRQDAALASMIWQPHEIISQLSRLYALQPGDLIFTGTPAGVGAVVPGDQIELCCGTLEALALRIDPTH